MTPEEQSFLNDCRQRAQPPTPTVTLDEMKRCIMILRGSRKMAVEASAASKSRKAKPAPVDISAALADLEGF